jgi:hypothetical protein
LPPKAEFPRALPQYAWTDPEAVSRCVREHAGELARLSRREALKNTGGDPEA